VNELLSRDFHVTAFYYNPNISPESEYRKRLEELKAFSGNRGFNVLVGSYDIRLWTARVKEYRFLGERSLRCRECIRMRLEKTFETAAEQGTEGVAATMSISPHKDAEMINSIGKELEEKFGIEFLRADFKKNNGYKKSVEISREMGFYRQNYCGCIYSKMERNRDSIWMRKTFSKRSQVS
jgi:predicted adenine nucleotide alpha hydrolase (AANH) superfamily ATPase